MLITGRTPLPCLLAMSMHGTALSGSKMLLCLSLEVDFQARSFWSSSQLPLFTPPPPTPPPPHPPPIPFHTPDCGWANWLKSWVSQVRSEQQRAKEEAEKKLQKYIRQLDHFERARREEEAPLIEEAHKKQVRYLRKTSRSVI